MPEHTSQPMTEEQANLRDQLLSDGKATPDGEDQPWPAGVLTPDEVMELAKKTRAFGTLRPRETTDAGLTDEPVRDGFNPAVFDQGGPVTEAPFVDADLAVAAHFNDPQVRGSSTPEQLAELQREGLLARGDAAFRTAMDHMAGQTLEAGRLASAASSPWGVTQQDIDADLVKAGALAELGADNFGNVYDKTLTGQFAAAEPTTQLLESDPVAVITAPPNAYGTLFAVKFSGNRVGHLELPIIAWDSNHQALFIESSTGNLVTAESVCGQLLGEQTDAGAESVEVVTAGPMAPPPAKVPGQPARTQGGLVLPGQ